MKDFDDIYRVNGAIIIKGAGALDDHVKKLAHNTGSWPLIEQWDYINKDGVVAWKIIC